MKTGKLWLTLAVLVLLLASSVAPAQDKKKIPVILDTDIGSNIDDAFALGLLLNSPEVELRGITTCASEPDIRPWMVCRFLTAVERKTIPVAVGPKEGQVLHKIEGQFQYRYHPAVIFNRTAKPVKQDAVEFLYEQLKADKGNITILTTGPLTNIAKLLEKYPDCQPWIKQIIISGGAVPDTFNKKWENGSFNLALDPAAFKTVTQAKVRKLLVPGQWTVQVKLSPAQAQEIFAATTILTLQIQAMYQLWNDIEPILSDMVAARLCFDQEFCKLITGGLESHQPGGWQFANKKGDDQIVDGPVQPKDFLKWCTDRLTQGKSALPKDPPNLSKLIPADKFPNRVHAFEDFETDIEKRWWMSGKADHANLPPGSARTCRGVLTLDFDDLQGDMKTMYNAVIFNPVPGPPMGKQPRLSFRYWLKGTDTMRVQIYSLTKGYHRCLTLQGLTQGQWQHGTVDMTEVRRPDGSGGPLALDERIDDIQFYVDPRAELLIDDIVLYDAPVAGETRPFPKQFLFSGLFDTGKQGKEWPGTFEIVPNAYFWKAARSVAKQAQGPNWIRMHLRGPRPLGDLTDLFFRYHLTGAKSMQITLVDLAGKKKRLVNAKDLEDGKWAETTINLNTAAKDEQGEALPPQRGDFVEEIHFEIPPAAELLIDDLLLYVPTK